MNEMLKDKVAVIFGGNGDIGMALSVGLCSSGATVVPTGRNKMRIKKIIDELAQSGNSWTTNTSCDVRRAEDVKKLCSAVVKKYKRIDIVIYASGIYLKKPAEKVTLKEWRSVIDTNLNAAFLVNQHVGKIMLKQGTGSIINIGSLSSFVALSNTLPYSVSKAGIVSMTKGLSAEWASRGVRVNSIIPGVFPTRLNKNALADKRRVRNILRGIPMKRLGKTEELVSAAVFLASEQSSYVSGVSIPVDGGFLSFSGY